MNDENIQLRGFKINGRLNRRGKGSVYKGIQLSVDRPVALKIIQPKKTEAKALERFKGEAKTLAQISHPNVVQVLDLKQERGFLVTVMELVNGADLADRYKRLGLLNEETAIDLLQQSAEGLQAAHSKGIIHRDVKPSNLLLTLDGQVKVTDFGLAKNIANESDGPGGVMGTPHYISPEQSLSDPTDFRTDIYSLGASFYHLVSGTPPFGGANVKEIVMSRHKERLVPLTERMEDISTEFSDLIGKMLNKDINLRPQSMAQVVEECKRIRLLPRTKKVVEETKVVLDDDPQERQIREINLIELCARKKALGRADLNKALLKQREYGKDSKFFSLEKILTDGKLMAQEDFISLRASLDKQLQLNENKRALEFLKKFMNAESPQYKSLCRAAEKEGVVITAMLRQQQTLEPEKIDRVEQLTHQKLMNDYERTLASLAIEHKLLNQEQLKEISQSKGATTLTKYLIDEAYLKNEELLALLDVQKVRCLDHFFSHDLVTAELKFRDHVKCPHCGKNMFVDEVECRNCRKSSKQKRSDNTRNYGIEELDVVKEELTQMTVPEWFLKTKTGQAGPFTLKQILSSVAIKKITMNMEMRRGHHGDFKAAVKWPFVARAFGLCYQCGGIRSKKEGPCKECGAVEK